MISLTVIRIETNKIIWSGAVDCIPNVDDAITLWYEGADDTTYIVKRRRYSYAEGRPPIRNGGAVAALSLYVEAEQ